MSELAIIGGGAILFLSIFGLVALRWGVDSRDGPESPEWQRRQQWFGRR